MLKHKFFKGLFVLFAVFFSILPTGCEKAEPVFKCTDSVGCVTIAPDEPIRIGIIQDLSGGAAAYGTEQVRIIELAVAGRGGRLLGHPVELQTEDEQCTAEGGKNAALKFAARPRMTAIIGTTCSGAAAAASEVISEAGLVMISGLNSAASLTSAGGRQGADWHPGYFRTRYNDAELGRTPAIYAFQELNVRKVATVNQGDTYTRGLTDLFEQVFTDLGGQIVFSAVVYKGDTDMRPLLTGVADSGAELIFFPTYRPEGDFIVQEVAKMKADNLLKEGIILMGCSALLTDDFIKKVNTDGTGMYFAGSAPVKGPAHDKLISEYRAKYGDRPSATGYDHGYDAANMLLDAIEKTAVREKDGTLHIGRGALRETMYNMTDFKGVTGNLSCDKFGDCGTAGFNIMRLDDPSAGIEGLTSNVVFTYTPNQQITEIIK
ncbi:branched-chain amino acid ABC transporter substrate-binding protein [Desulfobacterales bacterium HSG2]|nr:branched-chain amino acid ABC transporter substrate-binding protein [Desulfobacterales bacterium HSG2]